MSWSPPGNGRGLRRTALIAEKTALLAPMPNARVNTTVAVNPGVLSKVLTASRRDLEFASNHSEPFNGAAPYSLFRLQCSRHGGKDNGWHIDRVLCSCRRDLSGICAVREAEGICPR